VQRESFKSSRRVASPDFTAKQVTRPSSRFRDDAVAQTRTVDKTRAIEPQRTKVATHPVRATERARVVSTSGARGRASVDKADVAAMTKHATRAVDVARAEASNRTAVAQKNTRSEGAREKGSKKKQAR
jgi:hypothetical protein